MRIWFEFEREASCDISSRKVHRHFEGWEGRGGRIQSCTKKRCILTYSLKPSLFTVHSQTVHSLFTGSTVESLNTLLPCYHIHTTNTIAQGDKSRPPRHEDKRAESLKHHIQRQRPVHARGRADSSYKPTKFNPSTSERTSERASGCTAGVNEDEDENEESTAKARTRMTMKSVTFVNLWLPR